MYYVSQDTFDLLDDGMQDKVMGDTRKYYKQHGVPLPTELVTGKADEKDSAESVQENMIDQKRKADSEFKEESTKPMKPTPKEEEDLEEEAPKTWDDAHKKGMSLIIAIGKKKPQDDED